MSFFANLFFSQRKADKEYDETCARFQVTANATPDELIQKIREAIDYLVSKFWEGDRPKWIKIITTLGEFAGVIFQVIKAVIALLKNQPAK